MIYPPVPPGLAVQVVSGELVRRFGYDLLLTAVFLIYSVRLAGYSLADQSTHIFLCELLRPLGHSLALTLASHYLAANTSGDNAATLQVSFTKDIKSINTNYPGTLRLGVLRSWQSGGDFRWWFCGWGVWIPNYLEIIFLVFSLHWSGLLCYVYKENKNKVNIIIKLPV